MVQAPSLGAICIRLGVEGGEQVTGEETVDKYKKV